MIPLPLENLPGAELIAEGIADLSCGRKTVSALLVSIGAPRLKRLGFEILHPFSSPEKELYWILHQAYSDDAHSQYNALIRRLVSFEQAAECAS